MAKFDPQPTLSP